MKTYQYQPSKDYTWLLAGYIFMGFAGVLFFRSLSEHAEAGRALLIIPFVLLPAVFFFRVHWLQRQHDKYSYAAAIVDAEKLTLLNKAGEQTVIVRDHISSVAIYESWNSKPPFSKLGYTRLNTKNGNSIIITNQLAMGHELATVFRDKPCKRYTGFMHAIK